MKHVKFLLFEGIVFVILGILAIVLPWFFTKAITLIIGWLLVAGGVVQGIRTIQQFNWPALVTTLILLGFGIWFLVWPVEATEVLTVILAIFFFFEGLFKVFLSFRLRRLGKSGWILLSGIVSIVIAAIVWVGWPATAHWFIGLLLGINLLFFGLAQIAFAWSVSEH